MLEPLLLLLLSHRRCVPAQLHVRRRHAASSTAALDSCCLTSSCLTMVSGATEQQRRCYHGARGAKTRYRDLTIIRRQKGRDFRDLSLAAKRRDPKFALKNSEHGALGFDTTAMVTSPSRGRVNPAARVALSRLPESGKRSDIQRFAHLTPFDADPRASKLRWKPNRSTGVTVAAQPASIDAALESEDTTVASVQVLVDISQRWDLEDTAAGRLPTPSPGTLHAIAHRAYRDNPVGGLGVVLGGPGALLAVQLAYQLKSSTPTAPSQRWQIPEHRATSDDVAMAIKHMARIRGPWLLAIPCPLLFLVVRSLASLEISNTASPGIVDAVAIAAGECLLPQLASFVQKLEAMRMLHAISVSEQQRCISSSSTGASVFGSSNLTAPWRRQGWIMLPELWSSLVRRGFYLDAVDALYLCWWAEGKQLPDDTSTLANPVTRAPSSVKYAYLRHVLQFTTSRTLATPSSINTLAPRASPQVATGDSGDFLSRLTLLSRQNTTTTDGIRCFLSQLAVEATLPLIARSAQSAIQFLEQQREAADCRKGSGVSGMQCNNDSRQKPQQQKHALMKAKAAVTTPLEKTTPQQPQHHETRHASPMLPMSVPASLLRGAEAMQWCGDILAYCHCGGDDDKAEGQRGMRGGDVPLHLDDLWTVLTTSRLEVTAALLKATTAAKECQRSLLRCEPVDAWLASVDTLLALHS